MNEHENLWKPLESASSHGGRIALLILVTVELMLLLGPSQLAAAKASASPSEPILTPDSGPKLPHRTGEQAWPDVPIVFVSRNRLQTLDNIHVGPPLDVLGRERTPGGRLMLWQPDGSVIDLTAGTPIYDVQQPDVSFDGTRVVFSAVEEAGAQWHLYEIRLDGLDGASATSGFRQLTFDDRDVPIPDDPRAPGRNRRVFGRYGDFGPAYLPDGRIILRTTTTSPRPSGASGT
jgi:hypothetical protein